MNWKEKIELECHRTCLKDVVPYFNQNYLSNENIKGYLEKIKDDDKNNHLYLAIRKAIDLTEKHFTK